MPDIWSGLGTEIGRSSGDSEWLYKIGGEVRGPVPMPVVAKKLVDGELGLTTEVAREGGDFHPISRVAAFATHITEAKKQAQKRSAAKVRRLFLLLLVPVAAGLGVGGYFIWGELQHRQAAEAKLAKAKQEELDRLRQEADKASMKLVGLVSLGSEDSVKIRQATPPSGTKKTTTKAGKASAAAEPVEEMVMQCKLSQTDIFGTLKKNLGKINVCVEEEKKGDTQNLLPESLELSFVVQTSGKVTDFEIGDRHYRKGPLNNCMTKVFNQIAFPASDGANCPVSIPIKIGK